jgi:hypothetical protein
MAAEYEYTVVQLPKGASKDAERDRTDLINRVAAHGWRMIAVTGDPGQYGSGTFAYFERRVGQQ